MVAATELDSPGKNIYEWIALWECLLTDLARTGFTISEDFTIQDEPKWLGSDKVCSHKFSWVKEGWFLIPANWWSHSFPRTQGIEPGESLAHTRPWCFRRSHDHWKPQWSVLWWMGSVSYLEGHSGPAWACSGQHSLPQITCHDQIISKPNSLRFVKTYMTSSQIIIQKV